MGGINLEIDIDLGPGVEEEEELEVATEQQGEGQTTAPPPEDGEGGDDDALETAGEEESEMCEEGEEEEAQEGEASEEALTEAGEDPTAAATEEAAEELESDLDTASQVEQNAVTPAPGGMSPAPARGGGGLSGGVGGVETSSEPMVGELWEKWCGYSPEAQRSEVQSIVGDMQGTADSLRGELTAQAGSLEGAVDSYVEQRVTDVWSAFGGLEGELRGAFQGARDTVETNAQAAMESIQQGQTQAIGRIDTAQQNVTQQIDTGFDGQQTALNTLDGEMRTELASGFGAKIDGLRQLGQTMAARARQMGESRAAGYLARGGEDLDLKRNQARAKAARDVAAQCAEQIVERANQAATEMSGGQSNIGELVSAFVTPTRDGIEQQRTQAHGALRQSADQARAQVQTQSESTRQGLDQTRTRAIEKIGNDENAAVDGLRSNAEQVEQNLRGAGEEGKAELVRTANGLADSVDAEVSALQEELDGMDMPNVPEMQEARSQFEADLESRRQVMLGELETARDEVFEGLDRIADEGVGAMQAGARGAMDTLSQTVDQLSTDLSNTATAFNDGVNQVATDVEGSFGTLAEQSVQAATDSINQCRSNIRTEGAKLTTDLDQAHSGLEQDLQVMLDKLPGSIENEAEKAASKIQSGWRKVLGTIASIVVGVIIFVVVAAVVLATLPASLGTLAALCIAGAIAGAVAATVGLLTKELVSYGRIVSSARDYLAAAIAGFVGGALAPIAGQMSLIGGALFTGLSTGITDQLLDVFLKGQSFNLGEFLTFTAVSAVTFGLMKRFADPGIKSWFKRVALPGGNSWNVFQRQLTRFGPLFRGLTSSQRSQIYKVFTGAAGKTVGGVVKEVQKLLGLYDDPDSAGGGSGGTPAVLNGSTPTSSNTTAGGQS